MKENKTIVCDIDGVLCNNDRVPYFQKKPIVGNVVALRLLPLRGYKIILFTSRLNKYHASTIKWLNKNKVPFDKLIMGKPKADFYIDDKSLKNVTDVLKIKQKKRRWD